MITSVNSAAQLSRKYNISGGLVYHWKKLYERGKLDNEPTHDEALKERVKELECMVGRLTMDNDLLKKALQAGIEASRKKESLLPDAFSLNEAQLKGGAKC